MVKLAHKLSRRSKMTSRSQVSSKLNILYPINLPGVFDIVDKLPQLSINLIIFSNIAKTGTIRRMNALRIAVIYRCPLLVAPSL